MNRRQSLLCLSTLAAHALFPQVLEQFALSSQTLDVTASDWQPELVSPAQGALLAEVVEIILPETDTPGAKAARVHVFVDLALARCATPAQQQAVLAALDGLGTELPTLAAAARQSRIEQLSPEALGVLRDLTLLGYFTSQVGATQALAYEPVPGGYRGCVALKPGQRAWATR